MSLFDRYLAIAHNNQCAGNLALLCSLTTLQIAIKLHYPQKLEQQRSNSNNNSNINLASLSRGQFDQADIERMEWTILSELQWRLHAPTPYAFISHYLHLLPAVEATAGGASPSLRKDLLDLSRYLAELAVCDSYFCPVLNSTIALAAILNVMDEMSYAYFPAALRQEFRRNLSKYALGGDSSGGAVSCQSLAVLAARERLSAMFNSTNAATMTVTSPESPPPHVSSADGSVVGSSSPPSVITDIHHHHQRQNSSGNFCISSPSDLASLSASCDSSSSFSNGSSSFFSTKDSFHGNNNNNNSVVAAAFSTVSSHRPDGHSRGGGGDSSSCSSSSYRYSPSPTIRRAYHQHHHNPHQHHQGSANTKNTVSPCVAITSTHSRSSRRSSSPIDAGVQ